MLRLSIIAGELFNTIVVPNPVVVAEISIIPLDVIGEFVIVSREELIPTELTVPVVTFCQEVNPVPSDVNT